MYERLKKIINDYDLVNQTIENAKCYFRYWKEEAPEDFKECLSPYGLDNDLPMDFSGIKFDVAKIGYEIRTDQEDFESLFVVVDLMTHNNSKEYVKVGSYSCYYDMEGKAEDDFFV